MCGQKLCGAGVCLQTLPCRENCQDLLAERTPGGAPLKARLNSFLGTFSPGTQALEPYFKTFFDTSTLSHRPAGGGVGGSGLNLTFLGNLPVGWLVTVLPVGQWGFQIQWN